MKKRLILTSLIGLLTLVSCGGKETPTTSTTPSSPSTPSSQSPSSSEKEFKEVMSDGFATITNSLNQISTVKNMDDYFVKPSINVAIDSYATTILNKTIVSSDESVIPLSAITANEVYAEGSNLIIGVDIEFDLTKVKVGTSYIEIELASGNVSNQKGTVCKKVEVKEYGTVEVATMQETVVVDTSNLGEIEGLTLAVGDQDRIYGGNYEYRHEVLVTDPITTIVFDYAVGHNYYVSLYSEASGKIVFYKIGEKVVGGSSSTGYDGYMNANLTFITPNLTLELKAIGE